MSDDNWFAAASTAEVGVGKMKGAQAGGQSIVIYNVDGCHYATHDICTHAFAHLSDGWFEGKLIECPLHAGQFDVTTGKGVGPPIMCDIRTYPVRVVGETIEVHVTTGEDKR